MKPFRTIVVLLSVCILSGNSCGKKGVEPSDEDIKPTLTILDTTFVSQFINDSVKVDVSLPSTYNTDPHKYYPVVYMTDGYWRRAEHDTIHEMGDHGEIPQVIVVGIGYPDDYNFNVIRVRDLIVNSPGLLSCIRSEVIPYIERNYRADSSNRTLWGSSYGGHFLFYAFTEHEKRGRLFRNYIGASAALDPPYSHVNLIQNENILWESTKDLPVKLYMTVGGNESPSFIGSYNSIVAAVASHPYTSFRFEREIIPGTDHYTVWKPTLLNGLKMFLN